MKIGLGVVVPFLFALPFWVGSFYNLKDGIAEKKRPKFKVACFIRVVAFFIMPLPLFLWPVWDKQSLWFFGGGVGLQFLSFFFDPD